ncbi:MAG: SDR family oxidoreductase [Sphingomonadaceae bacterium]
MDLGIAGKTALVGGGSKGIGLGIARELAMAGCRIAVVARSQVPIDEAVAELRAMGAEAMGFAHDLSRIENFDPAIAEVNRKFGSPDIGIFNPPTPDPGAYLTLTEADFERSFHEVVLCFGRFARLLIPDMRERGWGRFVTVGSTIVRQPVRGQYNFDYAVANTSRLSAVSLCKTISAEVAPFGITVNTIGTGCIVTETAHDYYRARAAEAGLTFEDMIANLNRIVPVGREGTVEEMGALSAYLCSARAGYTTGETIICDGGMSNSPL